MKKIIPVLLLLLSTTAFAEYAKVTVNGIVCAFCAQGIKKKFSAESNVENTDVDLTSKTVKLKFKEGKNLADEKIKEIILNAGYEVKAIERMK